MPPTLIVDDRRRLVKTFVALIEDAAASALVERGRFAMAVTGGRDARVLLPALVDASVEWARTDIFWGDERAVPATHPESNYGQARQAWLDRSTIDPANVHPMPGDAPDLERAAREYAVTLANAFGLSPTLDACVLGVGPDGHVCSLFPGHPLLSDRTRTVAPVYDAPKPPPRRLTLTLPMLTRARLVVVTALSADKRAVLDAALAPDPPDVPITRVFREAPHVIVLAGA